MIKVLNGKRVIVLRSADQAGELISRLDALGAETVHCPMLEIRPTAFLNQITSEYLKAFSMIIFTSQNAVEYCAGVLLKNGFSLVQCLENKKIISVGAKTTSVLKNHDINAIQPLKDFSQEGVLELLSSDLSGETILLPQAVDARPLLADVLKDRHADVTVLPIYESFCPEIKPIEIFDHDFVIFTSSMMVRFFFESGLLTGQKIVAVCIGDVTKNTVLEYFQGDVMVAEVTSVEGIINVIKDKSEPRD